MEEMITRKNILAALLLCAGSILAAAQEIRITGFAEGPYPGPGPASPPAFRYDADGEPCTVLRMETEQTGWTFDAGLDGVVDISCGDGEVILWLPAGARSITVAHPSYGTLRSWRIPVSLSPGHTYSMKLGVFHPKPASVPVRQAAPVRTVPALQPAQAVIPSPQTGPKVPCNHFIDVFAGSVLEDGEFADCHFFGLRYTYIGKRLGPYVSAAFSGDEDFSFSGGLSIRLGNGTGDPDWQLYGGAGVIDNCALLGEAGVRVGWLSDHKVSRWDFGVGCQVWEGGVMPTVEVGLCIWGIPVCFCLGLALCAI